MSYFLLLLPALWMIAWVCSAPVPGPVSICELLSRAVGHPIVEATLPEKSENGIQTVVTIMAHMLTTSAALILALGSLSGWKTWLMWAYGFAIFCQLGGLGVICRLRRGQKSYFNRQTVVIGRVAMGISLILAVSLLLAASENKLPGQPQAYAYSWKFDKSEGTRIRFTVARLFPAGVPDDVGFRVIVAPALRDSRWTIKLMRFVDKDEVVKRSFQENKLEPFDQLAQFNGVNREKIQFFDVYLHTALNVSEEQIKYVRKLVMEGKGLTVMSETDDRTQ